MKDIIVKILRAFKRHTKLEFHDKDKEMNIESILLKKKDEKVVAEINFTAMNQANNEDVTGDGGGKDAI